jgi:hypothetical protein
MPVAAILLRASTRLLTFALSEPDETPVDLGAKK